MKTVRVIITYVLTRMSCNTFIVQCSPYIFTQCKGSREEKSSSTRIRRKEKKKNKTMAMRKKRSMYYQGGEVEAFNGGVDDQARRHRVVGLPPVLVRCGWRREMRLRTAGL